MKLTKRSQRQLDEAFAADNLRPRKVPAAEIGETETDADESDADEKSAEITLRLDPKLAKKLDHKAKKKGVSREAAAAKILKKQL